MINHLLDSGVRETQIISMNFESYEFNNFSVDDVYFYVKARISKTGRTYLFFDEVQTVNGWEKAINSFRVDFDCDIYVTGSNSYMLSSEYATYLSGRFVEIKMYTLSFREFLDFYDFRLEKPDENVDIIQTHIIDKDGIKHELKYAFDLYMRYGGMPGLFEVGFNQESALAMLDGIYSTVIVKDILEREKGHRVPKTSDAVLLKKIVLFLADNIGSNVSVSKISNTLNNEGLLRDTAKSASPSAHTVQAYVDALLRSYVFYDIKRFDIKGRQYLRTLGKYYIADIGLRNFLLGFRDRDRGHELENVVYFELLRRGFDVAVGKVDNFEIDFIATKADKKMYIQVTETMAGEETWNRELKPLMKIKDNYEKIVLTLDSYYIGSFQGINVVDALEWLINSE